MNEQRATHRAADGDRERAQHVVRWSLQPWAPVVAQVRRQIRETSVRWDLSEDDTERLLLVVNELVSNVVDHARTPFRLTVRWNGRSVRVLVRDYSMHPPRPQPHDPTAVRGRGLQMVQALASRWGWHAHKIGKTVWAALAVTTGGGPAGAEQRPSGR